MAAMLVTVTLLLCVLGGQAVDLLRATVTSGAVPPPVPRVHCWCSSFPNVTLCSWPEPSHLPQTHYIATYSERHEPPITNNCHLIPPSHDSSSSSSSEQLWHCELPNLKLLTDYIINVTAVNSGGSSSYLSSFMLEDIVKPDPPVDVQVSSDSTSNLLVKWSPPSNWTNLHIFPLKYQIMYQQENRGTVSSVKLGPFERTEVELKGLTPGRVYGFQVCAKELLDLGKCSNWSSPDRSESFGGRVHGLNSH
ncbi:interleukin-27 subunit beta isoform X3 [Paralichthys olivaceus]|uniref:interleukin-27 subunit beta isoform X3 n=1 Tax=Paralichthys olivaceus TaxID=8255 RepID=UPI003750578B